MKRFYNTAIIAISSNVGFEAENMLFCMYR